MTAPAIAQTPAQDTTAATQSELGTQVLQGCNSERIQLCPEVTPEKPAPGSHISSRPLAILRRSRIGSWVAPAATRGSSAAAATGTIADREIRKVESFLAVA